MKIKVNSSYSVRVPRQQRGMGLLDVVLAIVIFAVGMLALASLQGNLSRASADSNAKAVAINLTERIIEEFRSFEQIPSETGKFAYQDIVTVSRTIPIQGIDYTVAVEVEDWYFMPDREAITKDTGDLPASWNTAVSDFKQVKLDVSWAGTEFRVGEGVTTTDRLGSGDFSVTSIIPSIPVLGAAKIAADDDGEMGGPPVIYQPGQKPNVIPIHLDGSKFKESQTPMPDVIVVDEIVETWFDVVTYNLSNDATFIRREEFAVISCSCTLNTPSGTEGTGHLPTTWNGETYTEGEWVKKPYGESNNNRQSKFCVTCCRDHHDEPGNTGSDYVYDPWRDWTSKVGAHKHYSPTKQGGWSEAGDGDDYLEVCRMVRKDGFMRVAQDFRQEGLIATRQAFFTSDPNIIKYSSYVTSEVGAFYPSGSTMGQPTFAMPGDVSGNAIPLPTTQLAEFDQQVSRAVYVDHFTSELKATIDCVNGTVPGCDKPPGVQSYLEILPFYEIQTTWLSWWMDNVDGDPVFLTQEKLKDDNAHSRGLARLTGTAADQLIADTTMHRGNVGLTSTDPIDPFYNDLVAQAQSDLYIDPNGGGGGGSSPTYDTGLSGTIASTTKVLVSKLTFTGSTGVVCISNADTYDCKFNKASTQDPQFTITGYKDNKNDIYICDSSGTYPSVSTQNPQQTVFSLFSVAGMVKDIHLSVQYGTCP